MIKFTSPNEWNKVIHYVDKLNKKYPDGPTTNAEYKRLYRMAHALQPPTVAAKDLYAKHLKIQNRLLSILSTTSTGEIPKITQKHLFRGFHSSFLMCPDCRNWSCQSKDTECEAVEGPGLVIRGKSGVDRLRYRDHVFSVC